MADITYDQFKKMFFIACLALNFVTFPAKLAQCVSTDGVVCLVISFAVAYGGIAAVFKVMMSYPGKSFIEILSAIFGKTGGRIMLALYFANLIHFSAYITRLIGEQVVVYILREHPVAMAEIILLLTVFLLAGKRIRALGNITQLLFWIVFISLSVLALVALSTCVVGNLLPVGTSSLPDYLRGTAVCSSYLFSAGVALPFFIPFVKNIYTEKVYKDFFLILLAAFVFFAVFYLLCISILGAEKTAEFVFPAFSIVQSDNARSAFFERFEVLLLTAVINLYFIYTSVMTRSIGLLSEELWGLKKGRAVLYISFAVIFALVMFLNGETVGRVVYDFLNSSTLTSPHAVLPYIVYAGFLIRAKKGALHA